MTLRISLPLGKKDSVKNLVFTILTHEYPLKLIQLTNFIRKRYGKSVTFQAVRKATIELLEEGVIEKNEMSYFINKEWIKESKEIMDNLYASVYQEKQTPRKVDAIGDEISVFTFNSLNEMMKFWEDLIEHWFKSFQKGDYNLNCYQGAHGWEGLLHPDREKKAMEQLKHKGIKSYAVFTSNTILDKIVLRFYEKVGLKCKIDVSSLKFDKSYYVATYGDLVVQSQYPEELVTKLDKFFKKNKTLENLDLTELSDIVNQKVEIKLSVTKNLSMAKQINSSILSQIKD